VAAILFFASKKNSSRVRVWGTRLILIQDSSEMMNQPKKLHNDAKARFALKWLFGI